MSRAETAEFKFTAISKENGKLAQLTRFAKSRFDAWKKLEKEKGNVWDIKWA